MVGAGSSASLRAFVPPGGLLSRVRWVILLAALVVSVLVVPTTLASAYPTPDSLRALDFVGLAFLAWRYARG